MNNHARKWWLNSLDRTRLRLSHHDALVQLSLLGLLSGLLAGAVIILFRFIVEGVQESILPGQGPENYEGLSLQMRLLLPLLAGLFLAAMFRWFAAGQRVLGVVRVMERMAYHQGRHSVRGFFLQFFGAAAAIIGGHSVGREGPHIFLGASSASLMGQRLDLPNNSIRTLVACGSAAGIAASFNTPLAGVFFALEVVMMEYSVASFIPVILAAVSATALSQWAFGDVPAFQIPSLDVNVLSELPLVIGLGLLTGVLAALFIQMVQTIAARAQPLAIGWRMLLAGLFMGLVGGIMPEVMGIGYDSVDAALLGQFGLGTLLGLILLKLLATSACIGLGVPGGMIGPVLFLGACLGSLTGLLVSRSLGVEADVGFYALLGMGAMMGASLQAPLAALTAMLELTHVPGIIMPGMLAIVVASLTASQVFKKESLFIAMLKANGLDYAASPVMQALRRVGVASVMDTGFVRVENTLSLEQAQALLAQQPEWLLVDQAGRPDLIMPAVDLARWLADQDLDESSTIDLLEIPAERSQVAAIAISATLQQAWEQLQATEAEALYVQRITAPGIERIYGVLTLNRIESAYKGR